MVGGVYSLSHVLIKDFNGYEYPTYECYIIISTQHKIVFHEISKVTPFIIDPPRGFMLYPLTPSIYMLSHDRRHQKYIVGNILRSTDLTFIVINPHIPEAYAIGFIKGKIQRRSQIAYIRQGRQTYR
ncbi:hypothetical protein Hdeb2414_s0007g00255291 [Helianthus debilis subsp. tardiflorus]